MGFEPASGKVDFHFPWRARILESVNASNPVVVGDRVFISETYGPAARCCASSRAKPRSCGPTPSGAATRPCRRTGTRRSITRATCTPRAAGTPKTPSCAASSWRPAKCMWSQPDLTRASLLYVDGHFVCLSEDGTLRLLRANPQKYDPVAEVVLAEKAAGAESVWFRPTAAVEISRPGRRRSLSHGLLYVRGADRLVCLELIPGR